MKSFFFFISALTFFNACISIKTASTKTEVLSSEKKSSFNQKLADSLGADNYGMKSYKMIILKTGANDAKIIDKNHRAELFKGHFANMEKMQKLGKLVVAGPFDDNHLKYRGIFILDVKTDEEAKALIKQDPTIKAGVFDFEILPWYGSAALPMYLNYHEKVSKENP